VGADTWNRCCPREHPFTSSGNELF
jgi:hypothetical protein